MDGWMMDDGGTDRWVDGWPERHIKGWWMGRGWVGGRLCGLCFGCGTCRRTTLPSAPVFPSCRSWAYLLDLGSCYWWPRLSCSWPLHLYSAASASAVKVTTTHYPPRGRRDTGSRPCLWEAWLSPIPPHRPLSLNIFLALCAPLSFTVSRWMP